MTIETLVSAVSENVTELAEKMNLETNSIIVNQCNRNEYEEYEFCSHKIKCYSFFERGVGLSRNNALLRASADIILFSDEDIVYDKGYAKEVVKAFEERPHADMLLFNMEVGKERATYHTEKEYLYDEMLQRFFRGTQRKIAQGEYCLFTFIWRWC